MRKIIASIAISAAVGIVAATPASGEVGLADFAGMWEVVPRGPGPGGPPGGGLRDDRQPLPEAQDGAGLPGPNVEGLDQGDRRTYSIMTPAGRAAFEAMDPHDLPSNNCRSNGLPSLAMIPDLQDWSVEGDGLTIHYANFNTVRRIDLADGAGVAPPSALGHSTARLEDGVLTITTTGMTAALGGLGRNAPGSSSRTVTERYSLSADGRRLTGTMIVQDREYLTRDLVMPLSLSRAPEGSEIPVVECSVEASQRYLDG